MSSRFDPVRVAAIAAALAACSALSLADGNEIVCPAIDPRAASPAAAPSAGLRASVDPETGALRPPTAEERAVFAERRRAARAEAMRDVRVVVHPDGMRTANVGDAFLFDVVVVKNPDGTVGYKCVPKSQGAQKRELQ
ncbi:MAG TPA: hypothetical protein VH854_02645 [Thermoanaerobaculia bacterium]|jgi:hypothetical protein|nr:hypothetical protein [Thermoanaerobaculia bacterium]